MAEKWTEVDKKRRTAVTNLVIMLAAQHIRQAEIYQARGDADLARDAKALASALEAARNYLVIGAVMEASDG